MAEKADTPRKPRFLGPEIEFLLECIERYPIVKSEKMDARTLGEKENAWKVIAHEYNTTFPNGPRSIKNLQTKYRNEKQSRRKSQTEGGDGDKNNSPVSTALLEPKHESLPRSSVGWETLKVGETGELSLMRPKTEDEQLIKSLKKKILEKKLEILAIGHQTRLRQQRIEHEARMALLEKQLEKFCIAAKEIKDEMAENDSK